MTTPVSKTEQTVRRVVHKTVGVHPAELDLDANLVTRYNADSLDMIELVMGLEYEFKIDIPDRVFDSCFTSRDFMNFVEKLL